MTILNEYVSTEIPTNGIIIIGIVFTIITYVLGWIAIGMDDRVFPLILSIIGGATLTIMLFLSGANVEHKYVQATIDNDYPFAEIYEQYEIVSKDGEIYTLKEKENTK